ncbi:hypothetical protein [Micromonospora chersina]|uniref:hypothetical protein n=1 Tax=Micromonospora chersina TaxID=47854 RepID=UPI00371F9439
MLRLLPRGRAFTALVIALVLGAVGTVVILRDGRPSTGHGVYGGVIGDLRGLVGENSLFIRPGLSSDGQPSLAASGYALPALAAATGEPTAVDDVAALSSVVAFQSKTDPLWARWSAAMIKESAQVALPRDLFTGILDVPAPTGPAAVRVAGVAAVVDIAAAADISLDKKKRSQLADVLRGALGESLGAFSKCRAAQAADGLGLDGSPWSDGSSAGITLPSTRSPESLMDVYGALCVAERAKVRLDDDVKRSVRDWLEPLLAMPAAGNELESYYLVRSWLAAGLPRDSLQPLAAQISNRRDDRTGLVRDHIVRLGTLENTYYVAVLANKAAAFGDIVPAATLDAVRALIPQMKAKSSLTDMLMAAVILRYGGRADVSLEREAENASVAWLSKGLGRQNVVQGDRVISLMRELGMEVPPVRGTAFPVAGAEDRYLAWTMLGISNFLQNRGEVEASFPSLPSLVEPALRKPDGLLVKEVASAMQVPGNGVKADALPDSLSTWSRSIRGCPGYESLYRPVQQETRCSLEATVQIINLGLASLPG